MATYLDEIVARHRSFAAADTRELRDVAARAAVAGPPRDFAAALRSHRVRGSEVAVIAEIKRRSPSRGSLFLDLDPAELARSYRDGGAVCLSVLTDTDHFGGSAEDLVAARNAVELPVLRKDFTVSELDLFDARAMGADAVLLIVTALSDDELGRFVALAADLHLAALVEVHDEVELDRALRAGAEIVGVNQRDLRTFELDPTRALGLIDAIPSELLRVAESGIKTAEDVDRLVDGGYDAILVGEALVTAASPTGAIGELLTRSPARRS